LAGEVSFVNRIPKQPNKCEQYDCEEAKTEAGGGSLKLGLLFWLRFGFYVWLFFF